MAGKRKSRKRRRPAPRQREERPAAPVDAAADPRGYARSRARDEAARAALKPLRRGERPTAVTVGALAAAALALANLIALAFGYNAGDDTVSPGSDVTGSMIATVLLVVVAYGMWRARYWAVLGMQTLLALTIVVSALGLIQAVNWWAFLLVGIILVASGALFWFLVKAMARIQMPQRPGQS
jgi:CDP-diglyceride synthetase